MIAKGLVRFPKAKLKAGHRSHYLNIEFQF